MRSLPPWKAKGRAVPSGVSAPSPISSVARIGPISPLSSVCILIMPEIGASITERKPSAGDCIARSRAATPRTCALNRASGASFRVVMLSTAAAGRAFCAPTSKVRSTPISCALWRSANCPSRTHHVRPSRASSSRNSRSFASIRSTRDRTGVLNTASNCSSASPTLAGPTPDIAQSPPRPISSRPSSSRRIATRAPVIRNPRASILPASKGAAQTVARNSGKAAIGRPEGRVSSTARRRTRGVIPSSTIRSAPPAIRTRATPSKAALIRPSIRPNTQSGAGKGRCVTAITANTIAAATKGSDTKSQTPITPRRIRLRGRVLRNGSSSISASCRSASSPLNSPKDRRRSD